MTDDMEIWRAMAGLTVTTCGASTVPNEAGEEPADGAGSKAPTKLIDKLLAVGVLFRDEWSELSAKDRADLDDITDPETTLACLVHKNLLTTFQADMILQGRGDALVIGHYRLLEPLGRGGMGEVYRAEHIHLRNSVAVKIFAPHFDDNPTSLDRFFFEARAIARLRHPNIVCCTDAGCESDRSLGACRRDYYVMELVPGIDLEKMIEVDGPLDVDCAAAIFKQVAEALAETHRLGLIHRDLKPSNIIVTPDGQAKLLDFGLVHHPSRKLTSPGCILGTVDYMAPEQAADPGNVDARADVFSLGATLFASLTGRTPFGHTGNVFAALSNRMSAPPPRIRQFRPEVPASLDALVAKLMATDPAQRLPSAAAVAAALIPFTRWRPEQSSVHTVQEAPRPRVLIVDDDADVRLYMRVVLEAEFAVTEAADGCDGLARLEAEPFDLVVVDQEMPRMDGFGLIAHLPKAETGRRPMVLYMSGRLAVECLGGLLLGGADDFIQKPFTDSELLSRVRGLLKRRSVDALSRASTESSNQLFDLGERAEGMAIAGLEILGQGACLMLEELGFISRGYHARLPQYLQILVPVLAKEHDYQRFGDATFVGLLQAAALVHDIGMLGIRATILLKPGPLDEDERLAVQTHTIIGSRLFNGLAELQREHEACLTMAAEIARHHHERWDGNGYPDELKEQAIPITARVISLASVYDALRSHRPFHASLSHSRAVRKLTTESAGWFDPVLVRAFAAVAEQFDRVFQSTAR
jgi:response regulator RpfG family c-di-GMP phosphodiesterase